MSNQRIWLAAVAGFGILTVLFPWVTVMGLVSVSGFEVGQGWVVAIFFAAALALVMFAGPRKQPMAPGPRSVLAVLGAAAAGFGVWKYTEIKNGTIALGGEIGRELQTQGGDVGAELGKGMLSMFGELIAVGMGLYAMIATALALAVLALVKK